MLTQALHDINNLCGNNWLSRASARWSKHDWGHPLVSTYHFAEQVLMQGDKAILQSEHALKLIFYVTSISNTIDLMDSKRFKDRIRDKKGCIKLLYEIQIAMQYKLNDYEITFGDTHDQQYEFKVSDKTGSTYIECKKKGQTERDQRASMLWKKLSEVIEATMKNLRRYAYVFLEISRDPVEDDVEIIQRLIRDLLLKASEGNIVEGDYSISIEHIRSPESVDVGSSFGISYPSPKEPSNTLLRSGMSRPSSKLDVGPYWLKQPQFAVFQCEAKKGQRLPEVNKIIAIGFNSLAERDYIKTVANSFVDVRKRKQLPKSGPGIIYIEIGIPTGGVTIQDRFNEIENAVRPKLLGTLNRRVNALVLTCTGNTLNNITYNGDTIMIPAITTQNRVIQHNNPRSSLPSGFSISPSISFSLHQRE